MNKYKLESAKDLFFWLLGLDIFVTTVVILSNIWSLGVLGDINNGIISADASLINKLEFWDYFQKIIFITLVGVGVGLVKWLNACYKYSKEVLGLTGFKHEGWTIAAWIFPIIHFFKPYQIIDEIYKAGASTYEVSEGWKKEQVSVLLLLWWIYYVIAHLLGALAGKQIFKASMQQDMTTAQLIGLTEFQTYLMVTFLLTSGLWIFVSGRLTHRLVNRQILALSISKPVSVAVHALNGSVEKPLQTSTPVSNINQSTPPSKSSQPIQANFVASAVAISAASDDLWAQALIEYESGNRNQGLWARLFSEAQGNETLVKANYLRIRVDAMQQLIEVERRESEKKTVEAEQAELLDAMIAKQRDYVAAPKGVCPNCKKVMLRLTETTCPKCYAVFGGNSLFKIVELPESEQDAMLSKWLINGNKLTNDDVNLLVFASLRDSKILTLFSMSQHQTLLHIAAKLNNEYAVKILMQHGASLDALDRDGKKPYQMSNNEKMKQLLQIVEK